VLNLVTILEFARCGKGRVILKAKGEALLALPKIMWRKRQEIQQKKVASAGEIWPVLGEP